MGMYDSFYIEDNCPLCNCKINEIQSKEFDCILNTWKLKEKIVSEFNPIINGCILEPTYSCDCNIWCRIEIKNGCFNDYKLGTYEELSNSL